MRVGVRRPQQSDGAGSRARKKSAEESEKGGGGRERETQSVRPARREQDKTPNPQPSFGHRFPPRTEVSPPPSTSDPQSGSCSRAGKTFLPAAEPGPAPRSAAGQAPGGSASPGPALAPPRQRPLPGPVPHGGAARGHGGAAPAPVSLPGGPLFRRSFCLFVRFGVSFCLLPFYPPLKFPFDFAGKKPARL